MWYEIDRESCDGGTVLCAEEGGGAGITLEKDSILAPFSITFGVYGLGFHTAMYGTHEAAMTGYNAMKQEYESRLNELERIHSDDDEAINNGIRDWFEGFVEKYE